jgi:hypothetical protein
MEQLLQTRSHGAVHVEAIFLQPEVVVLALEVAGPVARHPLVEDQVLCARRVADRIELDELQGSHGGA